MGEIFGEMGLPARFILAFVLVLALIGLTAWLIRQFGSARASTAGGGRRSQPRLAVLDSAVVDARRRLVLIRRDNVEHLLLIGGPTDVVVEINAVRAQSAVAPTVSPVQRAASPRERAPIEPEYEMPAPGPVQRAAPPRERAPIEPEYEAPAPGPIQRAAPQRERVPIEPPIASEYDPSLVPYDEPVYEEPARPAPVRQSPPARPAAAAPLRSAIVPPRPAPVRPEPQYSDMAQRLEAALRQPGMDGSTPKIEPRAPMSGPGARPSEPRVIPPTSTVAVTAAAADSAAKSKPAPAETKSSAEVFSSLEEEMANLLKPGGKTPT